MRPRGGFGVILHAEGAGIGRFQALARTVIQVQMRGLGRALDRPREQLGEIDHLRAPALALDRLGGRYKEPSRSPFRADVKAPVTELEPIQLKASDAVGQGRKP